jgi:hypothetical protein
MVGAKAGMQTRPRRRVADAQRRRKCGFLVHCSGEAGGASPRRPNAAPRSCGVIPAALNLVPPHSDFDSLIEPKGAIVSRGRNFEQGGAPRKPLPARGRGFREASPHPYHDL